MMTTPMRRAKALRSGLPRQSMLVAYAAASAVGTTFWCLDDSQMSVLWAVRDREYVKVRYINRSGYWVAYIDGEPETWTKFTPLEVSA